MELSWWKHFSTHLQLLVNFLKGQLHGTSLLITCFWLRVSSYGWYKLAINSRVSNTLGGVSVGHSVLSSCGGVLDGITRIVLTRCILVRIGRSCGLIIAWHGGRGHHSLLDWGLVRGNVGGIAALSTRLGWLVSWLLARLLRWSDLELLSGERLRLGRVESLGDSLYRWLEVSHRLSLRSATTIDVCWGSITNIGWSLAWRNGMNISWLRLGIDELICLTSLGKFFR